eukprot:2964431-Amphidinium_carterae.1
MTVDKKRPFQESHPADSSEATPAIDVKDLVMTAEHADVDSMTWTQILSNGSIHKTPLERGPGGFCVATTRFGHKVSELPNYMLGVEPVLKAGKKTTMPVSKKPASASTTALPATSAVTPAPAPIVHVEAPPALSDDFEYNRADLLKRWQ